MVLGVLILRELRSAARQSFSYQLRSLGAGALLAAGVLALADSGGDPTRGGHLFARLHATLVAAIWCLVPLLTADCISRERREQTLPLLFLTPLKCWQIVLAKGMSQGLRAFTLWLAVLPVLTLPFIAGGVSWIEGLLSVLLSFGSICLAMGAGLLASTGSRVWLRAVTLAGCLGLLFFFGFAMALGFLASGGGVSLPFSYGVPSTPWARLGFGLQLTLDSGTCWQNFLGAALPPWLVAAGYVRPGARWGTNLPLLLNAGIVSGASLIGLLLLIGLAAWNVGRVWREGAPSARQARMQQQLCRPLYFQNVFQRWMRWEMNHNPIGWLQHRTWSARLVAWIWVSVFACIYSSLLGNIWAFQENFEAIQTFLAWSLVVSVAIASASSFRHERETGVLELLVVSPVRERQIITGRLRGIWEQFLPSIFLLLSLWLFCASFLARGRNPWPAVLLYGSTLVTLPVIGLYNSLARASFMGAFVGTLLLGVALPVFLGGMDVFAGFLLQVLGQIPAFRSNSTPVHVIPFQVAVSGICAWRLHRNLRLRSFALVRQAT